MAASAFPESPLEFGIFDWIEWSVAPAGEIFEHKLQVAEAADKAGFDAWHIVEHQGTPLSIDGSPAAVARLVIGAPKTVVRELAEVVRESGINYLTLVSSFGDLAPERAMRSMDLFVREGMPALRDAARTDRD